MRLIMISRLSAHAHLLGRSLRLAGRVVSCAAAEPGERERGGREMRLCWRVRFKSLLVLVAAVACLAGLSLVLQRSPRPAGEGGLSRGARGGGVEKERELEAILAEVQKTQRRETEGEREMGVVPQVGEGGGEEERRVAPRKALELKASQSPSQRGGRREGERGKREGNRRYPVGLKEREEAGVMVPLIKKRVEGVRADQNQRRLFSERRNRLPMDREGRRHLDEEGFPHHFHFLVDLADFDPEAYLAGQQIGATENEMKRFQFNQRRSQETSYDRELKDVRNPSCAVSTQDYLGDLPATSVIICFHNEARSALLRTIYSVLHRSPPDLISEIILVDDFSNDPEDGQLLTAIPKVRLERMRERSGLMRARVKGAELAVGPVLTFLDSHCEVTIGWLQPLLSRIKMNHTHVVSPIIDIIHKDSMQYTSASPLVKGGFGHNLHFRWDQMSQREIQARARMIDPIRSPAIAGGLFSVDKAWFSHLGMYDSQMEIWGGENIELSLRVWMCGGELEIMPCSRVGHIFRSAMPYTFGPGGTYQNTVAKNIRRTVEVWLDEYKPFFYEQNPFSREVEYGDISERLALKEKLQCKSFSWYLKKVYPLFDPPPTQDFTYGQLRQGRICLDSLGRRSMQPPELRLCDPLKASVGGTQGWAVTKQHEIKAHPLCLTHDSGKLFMSTCNGSAKQLFHLHGNGVIQHGPTNSCLAVSGPRLYLEPCDVVNPAQIWEFVNDVATPKDSDPTHLRPL